MGSKGKPPEQRHPMRRVVLRTGLKPDVLRAWERRYGVVAPIRSEGGQRLYSDEDVERLSLLTRAVSGGRAISQVAKLPLRTLRGIVEEDANAPRFTPAPVQSIPSESRASVHDAALAAIESFDSAKLESVLRGAVLRFGIDAMLDGVIGPLLITIGSRWRAGMLGPAQEHLATAVLRRMLNWMMENGPLPAGSPALVVATLTGQAHELGAMLAAAAASSEGWRVVYLGSNLPPAEIAAATVRTRASAIALSFVYPADDPAIAGALRELHATAPAKTTILAGGSAAANYASELAAVGASRLGSISELRSWLRVAIRAD
jgi:MerR family transcriptional regulator, light-induced transcriptional regulator